VSKENKSRKSGGEVMEAATETIQTEQYWVSGNLSKPRKPPKEL